MNIPLSDRNLVIIFGQEGAGKSTTISRLVHFIPHSAQLDAENVGQVNPWVYNDDFLHMLWKNVRDVTFNFWEAGYHTVITGSFFDSYAQYQEFLKLLPPETRVRVIQLSASKAVRDQRRALRSKPYDKEISDWVDEHYPENHEFSRHVDEVDFFKIDTSQLSLEATLAMILDHLR